MLKSPERNPIHLFLHVTGHPSVELHGPVHHAIVPVVLLTAFKNNGGEIDLSRACAQALQRGGQVPPGICGFWGSCGAAIGAGIFASVATGANPLSREKWALPQIFTARCLDAMAAVGGPRCCKRVSRIAIETAAGLTQREFGITMPIEQPDCTYQEENKECLREDCPYGRLR